MRWDRPDEVTEYEFLISKVLELLEENKIEEAKKILKEKNDEINENYN